MSPRSPAQSRREASPGGVETRPWSARAFGAATPPLAEPPATGWAGDRLGRLLRAARLCTIGAGTNDIRRAPIRRELFAKAE